jgi:hypothetical protein
MEFITRNMREPTRQTNYCSQSWVCLSTLVALWLFETRRDWDPQGHMTIDCLPFAALTPGDRDFSDFYTNSSIGGRSDRYDNPPDAVPHIWKAEDLKQLPGLYGPTLMPGFSRHWLTGFLTNRRSRLHPQAKPLPVADSTTMV